MFRDVPADLVDMRSFWRHSVGCGVAARVLATFRREGNVERFFVAGLLHDIGALLLYSRQPELARLALERCRRERRPLHEVEADVLGYGHATAGGALLEAWGLPAGLQDMVAHHHQPGRARRAPGDVALVHVADVVADALDFGSSGDPLVAPLDAAAWDSLGLEPSILAAASEQVERQFEAAVRVVLPDEG
jgi:HD-like signal output (HDOD) protein